MLHIENSVRRAAFVIRHFYLAQEQWPNSHNLYDCFFGRPQTCQLPDSSIRQLLLAEYGVEETLATGIHLLFKSGNVHKIDADHLASIGAERVVKASFESGLMSRLRASRDVVQLSAATFT
jgi:hypothetical protein